MEKEARVNTFFGETVFYKHIGEDKKIIPHIEKFVKEKPGTTAATTDVVGNTHAHNIDEAKDNLHTDKKYSSIFKEIATAIHEFIGAKGYNKDRFDIHITKSWATHTAKDQHIASHKHTASHFSFVYYVRNQLNFASYMYPVKTGDFLIFPSGLLHQTEINTKDIARISISGDVLMTMKPGIKTEHCIPHPDGWKTI